MALKIRLSRAGAKKRPFYRVVVADSRRPRDGRFLERLGTFDPMLPKDHPERVRLNVERVRHWLDVGALPSDRVARFLGAAEIIPMPAQRNNPQKAQPKAKALERQAARAEKAAAAANAQAEAPAEAAPEEAAPEEAAPEEAAPEEAAPRKLLPKRLLPKRLLPRKLPPQRPHPKRPPPMRLRPRSPPPTRPAQAMARPKRKPPTEASPGAHGGAAAPIEPAPAGESRAKTVCLGRIVGAHGVRGIVRVQSYAANPDDLTAYGALSDASGARRFTLSVTGHVKGLLLARIEGVDDRNAAEALRGTDLHIARAALPPTEGEEFYHVDLLGLRAENADGDALGQVSAIHDHGAGPIVEIQPPDGPSTLVPFTREHVPAIDIEAGRMVVVVAAEDGS